MKGGNTDFITFKNAIAFYFIVFFGVIGMGYCGLKRFPCAGDIFLILFEAARKCQHWSIRALLLQLPPSALSQASVPHPVVVSQSTSCLLGFTEVLLDLMRLEHL